MAAAAAGITSPARVRLTDLVATDGVPSESYKHAVATLSQSLRNFNAAIIQVPHADDVLLRCVLDSVRMFFHKKTAILQGASDSASEAAAAAAAGAGIIGAEDPQSWNRTAGYYAEPRHARETYDFRPGRMIHNEAGAAASSVSSELPPAGLPEVFAVLGSASRTILDAIGSSLDLRSYWWTDLLDNVPLKAGETSTSVLSTCCQNRYDILPYDIRMCAKKILASWWNQLWVESMIIVAKLRSFGLLGYGCPPCQVYQWTPMWVLFLGKPLLY